MFTFQVHGANQTKFLIQLAVGGAVFGGTVWKIWDTVYGVQSQCNSTPHHLLKN